MENDKTFSNLKYLLKEKPAKSDTRKHQYKPETIHQMAKTCCFGRLQDMLRIITDLPEFIQAKRY